MTSNNNNKMGFTQRMKVSVASIASAVFLLLVFPVGISATEGNQGGIDPEYTLRLNDSEAGFFYFERVVDSEEGPILEIGMELHDQKTMGRYGCEQTLRKVVQDLAEMGIMSEEDFGEPLVDEETFYTEYKNAFLRYADNIRPYSDLQNFFSESLRIWHEMHCMLRNRFESNPDWYLNLPAEQVLLNESGLPVRRTYLRRIPGISGESVKKIQYNADEVVFAISSEGYDNIRVSSPSSGQVYDPYQINMIISSLDYHEGFEQTFEFKRLYLDIPLYEEWPEEGPGTEVLPVELSVSVAGSMFLAMDGEEIPVWAVDARGFREVSYHPLFHLYDSYHRRFDTIRYYVCQSEGDILMMEALTSGGRPVGIYRAE